MAGKPLPFRHAHASPTGRILTSSTDEPRRSGRATKGQYTKDRDINEDAPGGKKKGKGKGGKAKPVEEEEDDDEEEGEIIRCICGTYEEEEDNPRTMICCDKCSAWQHNECMGLAEDYQPDKYFCEQCKPQDHKELLAAVERGEKPWEERIKQREAAEAAEAAEKARKKGKKGRKSAGGRASEVPARPSQDVESSTPVPPSGQKRKAEESPVASELKVCIHDPRHRKVHADQETEHQESARHTYRRH